MGVFLDKSIKEVVDGLNVRYFLPDIQREYVWLQKADEKKIEQLFDSILRGYPIGSFLFWKLQRKDIATSNEQDDNKLNFQLYQFIENYDARKPHNEKIRIEQIKRDDLYIILDGQQRLTSEEKRLYLNLKQQPNMDNPEDDYQFEFHTKTPENDKKHWWFKVGDILELKSVINYAREQELDGEESALLENLKNAFCTEKLISYFEETEKDLDKVLNIFIRMIFID
nr:DUF262 domain-containing protein [Helicobacter pylori]